MRAMVLALGLCVWLVPEAVTAQTNGAGRWLLVFDASSTMKSRLPATAAALRSFLLSGAQGELQDGDSVAVWVFDKSLQPGKWPLQEWKTDKAGEFTTNLMAFVQQLRYSGSSSLPALQNSLSRVVATSEKLTVIIFCDGQSPVTFTPYNEGINQSFKDNADERKKSKQPFLLALRTAEGNYVGGTVCLPPQPLALPPFPSPAVVTNKGPELLPGLKETIATMPPPAPVETMPPLVIVGNRVGTNLDMVEEATQKVPLANTSVPPKNIETTPTVLTAPNVTNEAINASVTLTTNMPGPRVFELQTNMQSTPASSSVSNTIPPLSSVEQQGRGGIWLVAGLSAGFGAVVMLVLLRFLAGRRPQTSLISSSMDDKSGRK